MESIRLLKHNQESYENILNMIKKGEKRIGVVQPTGTGKSYLIAKVLEKHQNLRKLFISPSKHINNQLRMLIKNIDKVDFLTYAKLLRLSEVDFNELDYDIIILDEFHRCGAEIWGNCISKLLTLNEDKVVIGTSATPIRYLDSSRDMGDILFKNNLAVNMSLVEAMATGVIPTPHYVSALYCLDDILEKMKINIDKSGNSEEDKVRLKTKVISMCNKLNKSKGVDVILRKHLDTNNIGKTIIFCKNEEHLREMQPIIISWFEKAFPNLKSKVECYSVLGRYGEKYNKSILDKFSNAPNDKVSLLLSVDMLNEGVHIHGVNNLILLRPTTSPTLFYQQLGRALTSGGKKPIVFDLVRNVNGISANMLSIDLLEAFNSLSKGYSNTIDIPEFKIYDEITEVLELFEKISNGILSTWDAYYLALLDFYNESGNTNITAQYIHHKTGLKLGRWVFAQKQSYGSGSLSKDRELKLRELGLSLEQIELASKWQLNFENLVRFKSKYGHILVPNNEEYIKLNSWCRSQRQDMKKGKISLERIDKLKSLGITDSFEFDRDMYMLELYRLALAEDKVPTNKTNRFYHGQNLYTWILKQKTLYAEGTINKNIKEELDKLNFSCSYKRLTWAKKYEMLEEWCKLYGLKTLKVSTFYNDFGLGNWLAKVRQDYKNSLLTTEQIEQLTNLGIILDSSIEDTKWKNYFKMYLKKLEGYTDFSEKDKSGIKNWVHRQRNDKRDGKLASWRVEKLNEVGFKWYDGEIKTSWDSNFNLLKHYKNTFGDIDISRTLEYKGVKLGSWLTDQRVAKKNGKLSVNRIDKLNELGVIWDKRWYEWYNTYLIIVDYKNSYGNCKMNSREVYKGVSVGVWCKTQRKNFENGKLEGKKKILLDKIGFIWK